MVVPKPSTIMALKKLYYSTMGTSEILRWRRGPLSLTLTPVSCPWLAFDLVVGIDVRDGGALPLLLCGYRMLNGKSLMLLPALLQQTHATF